MPMRVLDSEQTASCSPVDPRWQLVQRVAASSLFSKGPKLRAFLLYVCENSLQGKPENLTAQLIGTRVFGREPDYIPSEDNIVRVEARELRKRLAAYFAGEGQDEPVLIDIPKGSYSPVFVAREKAADQPESALSPSVVTGMAALAPASARSKWLVPLLSGALVLCVGIIAWQMIHSPFRQEQSLYLTGLHEPGAAASQFSIYADLLGPLGLSPGRDALLVLSNPQLMTYFVSQSANDPNAGSEASVAVPKELKSVLAPALKEQDRSSPFLFLHVTRAKYTGIGEAVAAFHVGRLMDLLGRRVHLTQGRFLNWDHVEKQDLILLGGPYSNDWSFQSDAGANFGIAGDTIVNGKPAAGEQRIYRADRATDYALIQKLNTPYNFETVLIAGLSSAGTAAAGEFLANPGKMHAVHQTLQAAARGSKSITDWEVLLRVAVRDALPVETSVIAIRARPRSGRP